MLGFANIEMSWFFWLLRIVVYSLLGFFLFAIGNYLQFNFIILFY